MSTASYFPRENTSTIEERVIHKSGNVYIRKYYKGIIIGKGGFAKCYVFKNLDTGKIYAGKVIEKKNLLKERTKQKLVSEIKIHRSLKHPNVVLFKHNFEDALNVYIILELCPNQTLMELLKRKKRLTESEIRLYMAQLVSSIKYIHSQQIIHRDLKLGNLFLDKDMNLKLGDFGLAAYLNYPNEKKRTICGTPNYIAPEVLDSAAGHSYAADIWSMGVILYTMLVGRPPFETKDINSTYRRIRANVYSFPENLFISEKAQSLVRMILHTSPEARPHLDDILEHPFFVTSESMSAAYTTLNQSMAAPLEERAKVLESTGDRAGVGAYGIPPLAPVASLPNFFGPSSTNCFSSTSPTVTTTSSIPSVAAALSSGTAHRPVSDLRLLPVIDAESIPQNIRIVVSQAPLDLVGDLNSGPCKRVSPSNEFPSRGPMMTTPIPGQLFSFSKRIVIEDGTDGTAGLGAARERAADVLKQFSGHPSMGEPESTATPAAVVSSSSSSSSPEIVEEIDEVRQRRGSGLEAVIEDDDSEATREGDTEIIVEHQPIITRSVPLFLQSQCPQSYPAPPVSSGSPPLVPALVPTDQDAGPMSAAPLPAATVARSYPSEMNFLETCEMPMNSPAVSSKRDTLEAMHRTLEMSILGGTALSLPLGTALSVPAAALENLQLWVTHYVDYTQKYGIGYIFSDGSVGVYFNDSTKIIMDNRDMFLEYYERNVVGRDPVAPQRYATESYPDGLLKKVTLLNYYKEYLKTQARENPRQTPKEQEQIRNQSRDEGMVFVKKWIKTRHAVLFRLSNKTVQEARIVTYVDKSGRRMTELLTSILSSEHHDVIKRLRYTRDILHQLLKGYN